MAHKEQGIKESYRIYVTLFVISILCFLGTFATEIINPIFYNDHKWLHYLLGGSFLAAFIFCIVTVVAIIHSIHIDHKMDKQQEPAYHLYNDENNAQNIDINKVIKPVSDNNNIIEFQGSVTHNMTLQKFYKEKTLVYRIKNQVRLINQK